MRRLARYTLNTLTVLSLLLCAATVALWALSQLHPISVRGGPGTNHAWFCSLDAGRIRWSQQDLIRPTSSDPMDWRADLRVWQTPTIYDHNGAAAFKSALPNTPDAPVPLWFHHASSAFTVGLPRSQTAVIRVSILSVPLWLMAVLLALPGSSRWLAIYLIRRYRSRGPGQCIRCGYDLTGNVSGACPECGASATPPPPPPPSPPRG